MYLYLVQEPYNETEIFAELMSRTYVKMATTQAVFPDINNGCQEQTLGVEGQRFCKCLECDETIQSKCWRDPYLHELL
jgi:hypothetical protein